MELKGSSFEPIAPSIQCSIRPITFRYVLIVFNYQKFLIFMVD